MSLYRTYRPKSFEDMAGQAHVIDTLRQAVAQDKLSHAYLFSGTRGSGKTSTARILAKILLTRGMEEGPLKQQVEESVDDGNLVDLVEIDAASNRGIDDIRSLVEKIQFSPVVAKAKVYIIDEVHMLTREAFNALLKTLEEPPAYAYFILATTELHKIPATIQSRCQRYLFRQIREDDIVGRLRFISDKEKIDVDDEALYAIARHVQGGLRDAISLLDQLRAIGKITIEDVRDRIGESGAQYVSKMMEAVDTHDGEAIVSTVRSMEEAGVPLEQFVRLMLNRVRADLHKAIQEKRPTASHERMIDALLAAARNLRIAPVPGLVVESALLGLCNIEQTNVAANAVPSNGHKSDRGDMLRSDKGAASHSQPPTSVTPKAVTLVTPPAVTSPVPPSPSSITLQSLKAAWPEIIAGTDIASARMSLKSGMLQSIDGDTVTVNFSSVFNKEKASSQEGSRAIEASILRVLGKPLRIKAVMEGSGAAAPATPPSDEMVNLADAAADIF